LKRSNVVYALITDEDGKLLVVKNVKGDWDFPGGTVEEGETLEEAIIREVKEETGFNIAITGLHSLREAFFDQRACHTLIITFYAKIVDGEISIQDPDHDITEVKWVDIQTAWELMPFYLEKLKIHALTKGASAFYAFEEGISIK
jgi:8-oxo-dGTP diphosphatase